MSLEEIAELLGHTRHGCSRRTTDTRYAATLSGHVDHVESILGAG